MKPPLKNNKKNRRLILDGLVGQVVDVRNSWPTTRRATVSIRGQLQKRELTLEDYIPGFEGFWQDGIQPGEELYFVILNSSTLTMFKDCRIVHDLDKEIPRIYLW